MTSRLLTIAYTLDIVETRADVVIDLHIGILRHVLKRMAAVEQSTPRR